MVRNRIYLHFGDAALLLGFLLSLLTGCVSFRQKEMPLFKEIIRLYPRAGAAYNNLAQILMERGQYSEALEMARKAVTLGGPSQAMYHQTLQEIESKMSQ